MIRLSAYLAILFGLTLAIGELARNWGDWQWWPFWLVDYIAAALLIFGAIRFILKHERHWLTGGWGFTSAMFYMSFFSHVARLREQAGGHTGPMDEQALTNIIGVMTATAFAGFVLTLAGKSDQ